MPPKRYLKELLHLVGVGRHGLQMLEGPGRFRLGAVQADHAAEVVAPDALKQPRLIQTPVPGRGWLGEEQQQDVRLLKTVANPLVPVVHLRIFLREETLHASTAQLRQDAFDGLVCRLVFVLVTDEEKWLGFHA